MREVQIYINDQRIDLFGDEGIQMTSRINDVRDISKVFTDFTQDFSIPASTTNNKLFKHFYNVDISIGSFDGRKYQKCDIYLNHLLFKRGRMVLKSVIMKNHKATHYKITFFGSTVTLQDILGEDKLHALDFSDFDHTFSYSNVKTIFKSGLTVDSVDEALIYPLITSKKRLFYNSTLADNSNENFNGNLYHTTESSPADPKRYSKRGVNELDLKPAVKVTEIIKLIEDKYSGISFTDDSFLKKTDGALENLYLWMSNRSGNIFGDGVKYNITLDNYALNGSAGIGSGLVSGVSTDGIFSVNIFNFDSLLGLGNPTWNVDVIVNDVGDVGTPYTINVISQIDGETLPPLDGSGDKTLTFNLSRKTNFNKFKIDLSATAATTYTIQVKIRYSWLTAFTPISEISNLYDVNNGNSLSPVQDLRIKDHLPDLQILDFLTGMFKMFNLTAYFIDDENSTDYGKIRVLTFDEYYNDAVNNQSGGIIDVTEYIDVKSHTVSASFPYSDIDFQYSDPKTLLIEQHLDAFGVVFGNSNLPVSELYPDMVTGKKYEIKVPFSHLKYERLLDGSDESQTEIQWGYAAGGDFNPKDKSPYLGYNSETSDHRPPEGNYSSVNVKPLLFYGVKKTSLTDKINFAARDFSDSEGVDSYFMPSNSKENPSAGTPPTFSINFDNEIDEFFSSEDFGADNNSLFYKFYESYVLSVFDPSKRIFRFTAFMPPSFLIYYKLNDQLKIQDRVYRINSITTDLTTGRTELELINLSVDEIVS
jgi:hypothetical protein